MEAQALLDPITMVRTGARAKIITGTREAVRTALLSSDQFA